MKRQKFRLVGSAVAAIAAAGVLVSLPTAEPAGAAPYCGSAGGWRSSGSWVCTFGDEFSGTSLDRSKWLVDDTSRNGYHSGAECFVDKPANVSVSGGALRLTIRKEAAAFNCASPHWPYTTQYTSGSVNTWARFSQTYGRFEIRAKFPAATVAGLHTALWLYPQNLTYGAWPNSGEIDIAEYFSNYPDRAIPYLHYPVADGDPTVTNTQCLIDNPADFHRYAAEWTPTSITIKYDGVTCLVHKWNPAYPLTGAQPFDHPFIVVLTQALGIGSNQSTLQTPLPATTEVDYVHVWSWLRGASGSARPPGAS